MKPEISKSADAQQVHVVTPGRQIEGDSHDGGRLTRHPEVPDSFMAPGTHDVMEKSKNQNTGLAFTKRFGKRNTYIAIGLAIVLLVAGSVAGYQYWQSKNKPVEAAAGTPPVVTVSVEKSKLQSVEDVLSLTGSVWAWDPLSVGTEISGLRITSVNVEEGDRVTKGQVLATLNSALLRAQLSQVKARLASSQANHGKALQPNRPEDILALKAALAQAEANVHQEEAHSKQARVNLSNNRLIAHRFSELARAGAVSAQDAENRQVTADTSSEEVKSADEKVNAAKFTAEQTRQKLLMAMRGGRMEDVAIAKANIEEITAQIKHLEEQIAQTVIRAPDNGVISKRDAHIGDIASVGTPLFLMIRQSRLELRAQVSDLDIIKIRPGQEVSIAATEKEEKCIGKVRLVNPLVDNATRMGIVRIDLPDNAGLKPGMFLRGDIKIGQRDAVTVPVVSLVTRHGQSVVFRLTDQNRAISTPVTVGVQTANFVEIKDGLAADQVVIAKGARFLSDNDVVRISK